LWGSPVKVAVLPLYSRGRTDKAMGDPVRWSGGEQRMLGGVGRDQWREDLGLPEAQR
jgi:hypothetical protein